MTGEGEYSVDKYRPFHAGTPAGVGVATGVGVAAGVADVTGVALGDAELGFGVGVDVAAGGDGVALIAGTAPGALPPPPPPQPAKSTHDPKSAHHLRIHPERSAPRAPVLDAEGYAGWGLSA
jgi:hypothetical protein